MSSERVITGCLIAVWCNEIEGTWQTDRRRLSAKGFRAASSREHFNRDGPKPAGPRSDRGPVHLNIYSLIYSLRGRPRGANIAVAFAFCFHFVILFDLKTQMYSTSL